MLGLHRVYNIGLYRGLWITEVLRSQYKGYIGVIWEVELLQPTSDQQEMEEGIRIAASIYCPNKKSNM